MTENKINFKNQQKDSFNLMSFCSIIEESVLWIRISLDLNGVLSAESESGSCGLKKAHKKVKNCIVLYCWIFLLRAGGFSCILNVRYGGQGI